MFCCFKISSEFKYPERHYFVWGYLMHDIVNLAANLLGLVEIIVFCTLLYLTLKFFQKTSKSFKTLNVYLFYFSITAYAFYRLAFSYASLPEPRQDYFELLLAGNLLFAVAGVSFLAAVRNLLKNSRLDIDGRN